jgi:cystathionine beta-lyase
MKTPTILATMGCLPDTYGIVNIPPYRASTILFPTFKEFEQAESGQRQYSYGRYGTPSTHALETTIATLEDADHAIVTSSGLAAIVVALMAFLKSGDHLLMVDSVYGPARRFCEKELRKFGVEITYYEPLIGGDIASLIKENTKVVYLESPGSLTFEVQDIPAIVKATRAKNPAITLMIDNTWATPLYFKPFDHGIDVSIHAVTKYMSGHSDLVMGAVNCKKKHYAPLQQTYLSLGSTPGGDNCYLALRGLRTMGLRLKQQWENAMQVAQWLKTRPEVEEVLYPALPGAPGHELWKRDFTGASSLFAFAMKPASQKALAAMLDDLEYFGMGYSWGGFESLITPFDPKKSRTAGKWPYSGPGVRLHIGLEDPDDLIKDLEAGFKRLSS